VLGLKSRLLLDNHVFNSMIMGCFVIAARDLMLLFSVLLRFSFQQYLVFQWYCTIVKLMHLVLVFCDIASVVPVLF